MMNTNDIQKQDKVFVPIITALSIAIPAVVALLMFMPRSMDANGNTTIFSVLPLFHALLNGTTAVLLCVGLYFIKAKKMQLHRICMLTAFILSSIFLLSYVTYHYAVPSTPFGGQGSIRAVYFFILISHIVLSTSIVPLALFTIYRSFTGQYEKHKKIARYTFPLWLYVAVTGVIVYAMMSPYYQH